MECALVLRNYVLYFSACLTRSSIVEFCVIFFCVWNVLWYHGISCYIFLCVERALVLWNFVLYFLRVERALVLWNFVLYFSVGGTRSGIVEFCVIFSCMPVKQAMVLWNFVLYISTCGMRSGIVEFVSGRISLNGQHFSQRTPPLTKNLNLTKSQLYGS